MRDYPHKPDPDLIARFLANDREDYEAGRSKADLAEKERRAPFFTRHSELAAEVAAMEYALTESWEDVRSWLVSATNAAQKATALEAALNPVLYMTYLALAVLCSNGDFRRQLESLPRARFTNKSVKADEIFYLAAEAMRDISAGHLDNAREAIAAALARLASKTGAKDGPNRYAKEAMEAILLMEEAIAQNDEARLGPALVARSEKYRAGYSKPAARQFPSGLLDITGLGLLRLARENGLRVTSESVYLPAELLEA